jgi:hypothetical protein
MGGIDIYPVCEQSPVITTSLGGNCVVHPLTTLTFLQNKPSSASKANLTFVIKKEENKTKQVSQTESTTTTKQFDLVTAHASKKPSKEQHQQIAFIQESSETLVTSDPMSINQNESKAKKSARLAAKRAKEFEAKEMERKEEEKKKASAFLEQKKAVRRLNDEMHAKLGIKNVPIQQRIRQYQEEIKRKQLQDNQLKKSKQHIRWYNQRKQSTSQYNAVENAAEFLQQKKLREKQEKEVIQAKQQQLYAKKQAIVNKAKQIVTKSTCEYVKGSYLLKKKKKSSKKKQEGQQEHPLTTQNVNGENAVVLPPPAPVSSNS